MSLPADALALSPTTARRKIWGWWAFDWASQPYFTLGLTFVFGPYFASVASDMYRAEGMSQQAAAAQAQSLWSLGLTLSGLTIACLAPLLGAMADNAGRRMPWIIGFSGLYVIACLALWSLSPDGGFLYGALIAFGLGLIAAEFTTIFTNSLLPELGPPSEIGRISGTGFAIGYAGGLASLVIMLLLFVESGDTGVTLIGLAPPLGLDPAQMEGTRAVGPFAAIWFALFMVPFFLWVREAPHPFKAGGVRAALSELATTLRSLPRRISLSAYLGSSMFYRDGLNALYGFGGTYAVLVLEWSVTQVGVFGILAVITSAVATWFGGKLDSRFGPKPIIIAMIVLLMGVCTFVLGLTRESFWGLPLAEGSGFPDTSFFICGAVIGGAGGILQATSRTLMCRHAEADKPSEAFGLYALSGKATAFLGPALIGVTTAMLGDARFGMLALIGLFAIGLVLLVWVNPEGVPDAYKGEPVP